LSATPSRRATTLDKATTNSWLFPPSTQEAQLDEKWSFVYKKQKHCQDDNPEDNRCGDCWDHIALDPEHRLVLGVVVGKRTEQNATQLVHELYERTDGRFINLISSDEHSAYATAIAQVYAEPEVVPTDKPASERLPEDLVYATVHKIREKNRVVKVETRLVFGTLLNLTAALLWSVLDFVNTVFIERSNGTDRHRNSRKVRKTYRFSKDWGVHEAMTYYTLYSSNYCSSVRTLRVEVAPKRYRQRTPAMAAGLTDHVWSLEEWLLFPSNSRYKVSPLSLN
jgi:IS1 family transposase